MIDSIGTKLRQAREARNLTLEQVSQALRIRPYHLQALESDDYSAIPSAAQARGFLRNYAEYLDLNVDELLPAVRPPIAEPPPPSSTTPTMAGRSEPSSAATTEAASKPGTLGGLLSSLRGRLAPRPEASPAEPAIVRPEAGEVIPPQLKIGHEGVGISPPEVQTPPGVEQAGPITVPEQAAESTEAGSPPAGTSAVKDKSRRKPAARQAEGRSAIKKKIS